MTKVNLNNEPNEIITGDDNIVIAKYLDGIEGGRSLDVTGYSSVSYTHLVERDIYQLIKDGDIGTAVALMQNREDEVDIALSEYKPELHKVMKRPNKFRKNKEPYISEKLPRNRQQFINEIELFFLLGKPIKWEKKAGDDDVVQLFLDFINETRFNVTMRKVKRLAGAETESAKLYHLYRNENDKAGVKVVVLAQSTGYKLRPLFDQYGTLVRCV